MMSIMDIEEEIEKCRMGAARRVAEWLTVPQDLEKLPVLRANVASKKVATDAQLKAAVTGQLDSAREGMALLSRSFASILQVRGNFSSIDKLCTECQDLIGHYDLVRTVNDTRNNLHYTRSELEKTLAIPKKVKELHLNLEDDNNLLAVHSELLELERLREDSLQRAKENSQQCRLLESIFSPVGPLRDAMDENLLRTLSQALPLAKERPAILIKAIRVVEREHKMQQQREEKAAKLVGRRKVRVQKLSEDREKQALAEEQQRLNELKKQQLEEETELRGEYREKCIEAVQKGIADRFKEVYADVGDDIHRIITQSKLLVTDLHDVIQHVDPCFPGCYKIVLFYIQSYHRRLAAMFSQFSSQADDLATAEILDLIKWVQLEYEPQLKQWGISEMVPLMDSLVPLMHSYKEDMRVIMDQWCTRLIESDRKNEPEEIDGKYYTDAPVLLFKFVNQQIDVVHPTCCSKLIGVVLGECIEVLKRYQESFLRMLQVEADDLFMEYLLATINNNTKCCDYTQELRFKIGSKVNADDIEGIDFNGCAEVFEKIAVAGIKVVVSIIFKDLEVALEKLFTKEWHEKDLMESIIATLKDYFEDEEVKTRIMDSSFRKLAQECLERLVRRYVEEMVLKKYNFEKKTTERMRKDEDLLRKFCQNDTNINEAVYDSILAVFPHLYNLVDAETDMITVHVGDLADHYPDLSLWIIETLLSKRPDLNKMQLKEAVETCGKLLEAKQENPTAPSDVTNAPPPTLQLFGSIRKPTGALSTLLGK